MSSFLTPLRAEYLDGEKWLLLEPFSYRVGEFGSTDIIVVPAGFETDFASIPRLFWAIYPPAGRWGKAAVVHDFLYRSGARPRWECDAVFLEGMQVLGVPRLRRFLMYAAVRLFGGSFYQKVTDGRCSEAR